MTPRRACLPRSWPSDGLTGMLQGQRSQRRSKSAVPRPGVQKPEFRHRSLPRPTEMHRQIPRRAGTLGQEWGTAASSVPWDPPPSSWEEAPADTFDVWAGAAQTTVWNGARLAAAGGGRSAGEVAAVAVSES